jgi:hypothetical protein
MESTAEEAIRAMGTQGGYIVLPPQISGNPTRYVSLVPGVGGEFSPKVPYWYYEGRMFAPSIEYMQTQAEAYVQRNLRFCIHNYTAMSDEYNIVELSDYIAHLTFADRDTVVELDYVIEITPKGSKETTKYDKFNVNLDVPVKKMHKAATEILESENKMTFFENMTLNFMGSHPAKQIPFSGMDFDCGRKIWLLSDIKKTLLDEMPSIISGIRFKNTNTPGFPLESEDTYEAIRQSVEEYRNQQTISGQGGARDSNGRITSIAPPHLLTDVPEDAYDYFQYYFKFTENNYKEFNAMASFKKEWGMSLVASPNEHGILKSGKQDLKSTILSFICINNYHFIYDVVYPVMITINAPEAFHGQGYTFRYAFPVQIFHNRPDRQLLPSRVIEPVEYADEFCSRTGKEEAIIITRDAVTNAEVSHMNLTHICFDQMCNLGTTRTNNYHLQWAGNMPEGCYAPVIRANGTGYLMTEKQFDYSKPFYIDMWPLTTVKLDLKLHPTNAPGSAAPLDPNMYAIIQIDGINNDYSTYTTVGYQDLMFNSSNTIELIRADAVYDLNIYVLQKSSSADGDDMIVGGWMGNWTTTLSEMLDASEVEFHVPKMHPVPSTDDQFIELYELMSNRSKMPEAVPRIIRMDEVAR